MTPKTKEAMSRDERAHALLDELIELMPDDVCRLYGDHDRDATDVVIAVRRKKGKGADGGDDDACRDVIIAVLTDELGYQQHAEPDERSVVLTREDADVVVEIARGVKPSRTWAFIRVGAMPSDGGDVTCEGVLRTFIAEVVRGRERGDITHVPRGR